jgi:hypothetical protein
MLLFLSMNWWLAKGKIKVKFTLEEAMKHQRGVEV